MKCNKCSVEVPSEYEFVLAQNVCPKCGNKLLHEQSMKAYLDIKKRLQEVEFVMDKNVVCERVAMFLITNYEIILPNSSIKTNPISDVKDGDKQKIEALKAQYEKLQEADTDLSTDEIRAQEASRAEEIALAREMGMDADFDDNDGAETDEEMVMGKVDANRVARLKKLAMVNTGKVGMIKRAE